VSPAPAAGRYDLRPFAPVGPEAACHVGWPAIVERLRGLKTRARCVLAVECYPGADVDQARKAFSEGLAPIVVVDVRQAYRHGTEIERMCAPYLGPDPGLGRMNGLRVDDFLEPGRAASLRSRIEQTREGLVLVVGTGASRLSPPDVVVYIDLARREIRRRQAEGLATAIGVDDHREGPAGQYRRGYFVDWRAADRLKRDLLPTLDFLLDGNDAAAPRMIDGEDLRRGLSSIAGRPFRFVPVLEPVPWSGGWLTGQLGLPTGEPGPGRVLDCAPEENSLLLGFGAERVEVPALDLVLLRPRELLGDAVHARFGTELPIRFGTVDTTGGGAVPLRVSPLTEYIQDRFGMHYAQDESLYVLAAREGTEVYLGLRDGVDRGEMTEGLRRAEKSGSPLDVADHVARWPARPHDHFLVPAGTVHAPGKELVGLEIATAPHLFGFALWDGERKDPEAKATPAGIEHAIASIQWERTASWVERELVGRALPLASGPGWSEEKTGLHERQFIETRRHWFSGTVRHDTGGGVHVLGLVEGEAAVVESPSGAFEPFVVHHPEAVVVPGAVGTYTVRPHAPAGEARCATIRASVRTRS